MLFTLNLPLVGILVSAHCKRYKHAYAPFDIFNNYTCTAFILLFYRVTVDRGNFGCVPTS